MSSQRNITLDLLRIFSIFFMMLIHVSSKNFASVPVNSFAWQIFNIYDSISRFCVPIFIMISGIYFLDPKKYISTKDIYCKRILRLGIALIFWNFFYALHEILLYKDINTNINFSHFIYLMIFGHYHLWFIYTLIGLYLIIPFLKKITEDEFLTKYFLILFFIFCLGGNFLKFEYFFPTIIETLQSKSNLKFFMSFSGYFVFGYFLNRLDISKEFQYTIYITAIASVFFTIYMTDLYSGISEKSEFYWYEYLLPNTFFVATAIFVFFKYKVSSIKLSTKSQNNIIFLSKISFGAYLVHDFFNMLFRDFGWINSSHSPIFLLLANTVAIFILSFFAAFLLSKIPFLNKYIL